MVASGANSYKEDTFFKGILNSHLTESCQNPSLNGPTKCFCKLKIVFDAKKHKDASIALCHSNKSIFAKFLIKSWLESFIQYNPNDLTMRIFYSEYLFHKLRRVNSSLA